MSKVQLEVNPLATLLEVALSPIAVVKAVASLPDVTKQLLVASVTDVAEGEDLEAFTNGVNKKCNEMSLLQAMDVDFQDMAMKAIYESKS